MSKSIGIDLGTTNSVGAIKRVQTEIIKNSEGDHITPSCVTIKKRKSLFSKHSFVVGKDALEWIKQDPENTVVAVKRLMGRSTLDNEVSKLIEDKRLSYHIQPHSKGTANSLGIVLKGTEYAPEEISAEILKKIRMDAETFLGGAVDYAVITVPAYFNDKQKHATRTAAAIAGLKVQRLLPEPTAAAISFGVDMVKGDEAATVLVFDFGGGTFDLSVLTISGGQFIEQGKGGDMWLGGEDLDRLLMEHVTAELAREYNIDDMEAFLERQNTKDRHRFRGELKSAVEKAKVLLSTEDEAYIEILGVLKDDDGDLIDVDVEVTRDQFEAMIAPMVEDLVRLTRKTLENIHFTPDLIDRVLLVGGSSQIPRVIAAMKELFSTEKVMVHDRPMLAVAEGAAILSHRFAETFECPKCGAKAGRTDAICGDCGFDLEKYIIDESVFDIVHSAAHDYYIRLENGQKHLFVEKNTPLPLSATETFKLVHPEQKLIHLKFFNMVNDNEESIGDLWLGMDDETTNAPLNDGEPLSVEITLNIDENNLIEVTATLKELPDVSLSKTLSRGSADEKLLVSIEDIIVEANNKKYGKYTVIDLLGRVLSAIRDANRIVDPETGRLDERLYNRADLKIQKARRMAADGIESRPVIYYANNALSSFEMLIPENRKNSILKAIETLKKMDEEGSYDENVKAIDDLHAALDDLGNVNVLMQIQKAGDICNSMGDRSRASKFYRALDDIMQKFMEGEVNEASAQITGIMPEVGSIIENYDHRTGIIYKDITR